MIDSILEIRNLRGGYIPNVAILQGIDLKVAQGETIGIIGLNGSGKSTLGKAVMNMIPWREGEIYFVGEDISKKSVSELSKSGFAIMQQGGEVFSGLSVWDNLSLAFGSNPDEEYKEMLQSMIPLIAQSPKILRNKMSDKLSGGQRHQLALAMTLARHPRLVVLDEPSAGLAPHAVDEMYRLLGEVRKATGVTILLVEQNVSKALEYSDRCIVLNQGSIFHETTSKNIKEVEKLIFKKS